MIDLRRLAIFAVVSPLALARATAADMPVAEGAEAYVRICDALGAGYSYIPGTETCLKLSGYVRAETHYVDGDPNVLIDDEMKNSEFNNWTSRARANVMFETQTATDFGHIEAYVEFQASRGPVDYVEVYPEEFEMPAAYVKIVSDRGTLTAGRTGSFFDFYGSDDYGTRIDVDDNTTEQNLVAYTLNGPGGLSATLSLEDPDSSGRRISGTGDYEGLEMPDLIGNIHLEQDWGSFQVMGMVRQIHNHPAEGIGWAASGGATLALPGDLGFSTQVGYADGALGYISNDPGGIGDLATRRGDDTNQAWMARAGLTVPFGETIGTWFDGSFTHAEDEVNDDEYDFWGFVAGAAWTPNDSVSMGPEFGFNHLDGDDAGEDGELWGVMWRFESAF